MLISPHFIAVFLSSLCVCYVLKLWFSSLKKFDAINHRSSHSTLATKTGGITVFITLFTYSFYYYFKENQIFDFSLLIPLGIMFIIGVYDDFYNADFKLKFFLQIIVAKILIDSGFIIDDFHGVLGLKEIPYILSQLFTVFVFLVIVNAINFIDGIDGLAITEVIKVIILAEIFSANETPLIRLGTLIVLALLPLYYFNFKKNNKVFLGDAGSLFLGTLVAIYIFYVLGDNYILKPRFNINKPLLTIVLIFYPLFDLLRVFLIRLKLKKSPFNPDNNHLHHLLIKRGFSHFQCLIFIQLSSILVLFLIFLIA